MLNLLLTTRIESMRPYYLRHNFYPQISIKKIKEWHDLVAFLHRIPKLFQPNEEKSHYEKTMGNIKKISYRVFK